MTDASVLNGFELPSQDRDNKLFVKGTMDIANNLDMSGNLEVSGSLVVTDSSVFDSSDDNFLSIGSQELASKTFTVVMPDITSVNSEVSLFPELTGRLIGIALILDAATSATETKLTFQKFDNPSGAIPVDVIDVTIPSVIDQTFSSVPTGTAADFTTSDSLRCTTNGLGTGTDVKAIIVYTFLLS